MALVQIPPIGENWTQIATGSLSGGTVSITGLSGYDNYLLLAYGISVAVTNNCWVTFNNATTNYRTIGAQAGTAINVTTNAGQVGIANNGSIGLRLSGATNALGGKFYQVSGFRSQTTAGAVSQMGYFNDTSVISSIQIVAESTTFSAGTYFLYGSN